LESRIFNSSVQMISGKEVLQLERFFVLAPIHKRGNSGTQMVNIIGLFRKTKGTSRQKFFSA